MEPSSPLKKSNPAALLPIGVFLVLYLGFGLVFEYILKIPMGFYNVSAIVVFLIALLVAVLQAGKMPFNDKMKLMARGVADENVLTMCLIFLVAGAFSGAISAAGGVDSTVNLFLTFLPSKFAVGGLFLIGCFISLSMGSSCATIAALAPIAVGIGEATGFEMALCLGAVVSGAMFGDNLSMISDTTIAAVRTQGCEMKDKFRMNFLVVLPAAVVTLVLLIAITPGVASDLEIGPYSIWKVIPYLVVLVGALIGLNVFGVLIAGTVLSLAVGIAAGAFPWTDLFNVTFGGVSNMYDITVISIIVACIGALVEHGGGIQAIIDFIHARINSRKGAQLGIAALVAGVDIATANNTIAIVMAGPIAKDISDEFGLDPRRTASLLDIFASVVQGILPYGAQLLYAVSGAAAMGYTLSSVRLLPYLYYPILMAVCALVFILFVPQKTKK
ncbi:Na+/H+ antiporter NhaC family protein [Dysosmobacter sp.]|uniref:Na+/H+ antiporter NhaC family protein n=1 Tax=Dysosmobacter sp. TaxID=2591382 RepID=UPI002A8BA6E9|nr:Na+/H+ antiporter NhaC family protein [Dysosmobacter sp.]MDY3985745.1 Na+/H+ antiporter NhaC family protein [Dysosmobacter sp.]